MANSARIDELRKKFDENPRRYFAPLANEYRKSGDLAQAVFILEEYLPQQQGHISGHIVYGQTLFELGRDEEAKRVFETALALDPENLIALRHLGHISRQAGDFDAARSWYQRLLEADPRDVEIEQLLGSLDSAAQAQAASLSASAAVESVPPPPAPMPEPDDAPFRVEHGADHDGAVVEARSSTHPLAPPPLSFSTGAARDAAATPADSMDAGSGPPPLPTPVAEEVPAPEPEHELLDLNDFSFGSPPAPTDPASAYEPPAVSHEMSDDDEAFGPLGGEVSGDVHDAPHVEASWSDPEPARESTVESLAEESDATDPIPRDMPVGFEPFSGLDSHAPESETEPVGGFESYTFESPEGPVAEPAEDVISYPSAGTFSTPSEPVEPTEGFESVERQFAAGVDADAARAGDAEQSEQSGHHEEPIGDVHEANAVHEQAVSATPSSTPSSTPAISTPAISTPIVASTPVVGSAAVSPAATEGEGDTFATETMARLYLGQGHLESALGIYRTLAARRPHDESLRHQIDEIEDRVQRRRREPTPPMPVDATPSAPRMPIDVMAMPSTPVSTPAATRSAGPTIRDFLLGIIRRSGANAAASGGSNGGTIDALFGAGDSDDALGDDLVAADTLARAFAPEPDTEPVRGQPTREASNELSLDTVFRQPTAAHVGDRASGGFSFDQFFAGERSEDMGAGDAPGDPDDIEQFNAWLNGLKKS